jgi:hypothetical protein
MGREVSTMAQWREDDFWHRAEDEVPRREWPDYTHPDDDAEREIQEEDERLEELHKEEKRNPLEREWDFLQVRAQELGADLASVKADSDSRDLGMEPYPRLRKALDAAGGLLESSPHERLANAIERELEYARYGLDKHREWMARELDRRGRQRERDVRERERDAETRAYRNAVTSRSDKGYTRHGAWQRQFEEDQRRVRNPNYRIPRTGD